MFHRKHGFSAVYTLLFIAVLSIVCAVSLSWVSLSLAQKKAEAKSFDIHRELLISSRIYDPAGFFRIHRTEENSPWIYGKVSEDGSLVESSTPVMATEEDLANVYEKWVQLRYLRKDGSLVQENSLKTDLPLYIITDGKGTTDCYVIPVFGYGLWDRIYGYIAIEPDGKTVRGISWYDQKETPGLGGVIADRSWQEHFPGKKIFRTGEDGTIDPKKSPLGIGILKGTVQDVYGTDSKGDSFVDGISGATLTGNGVTEAYQSSLEPYRPFFVRLSQQEKGV